MCFRREGRFIIKNQILGKDLNQWIDEYPLLQSIINTEEVFWINAKYENYQNAINNIDLSIDDVREAEERLIRFAPYIAKVYSETKESSGLIESPIVPIPKMKEKLENLFEQKILGELLLKLDSHLPISGSIKARGGFYEVLKHAEELAISNGLLSIKDDYTVFDSKEFRSFFSQYTIAVGSTGNLGLSIGIMGASIGFKVIVHMSADSKQWKKDILRSKGVQVIEYQSDYSKAVEEGRRLSLTDPNSYFIDDENSSDLFLGYAVAALRLAKQLQEMKIKVDKEHPLFVYLPCGVGGGPGGITFGLKLIYQDNVHCFFAEPTHSPCMLIGSMTGLHDKVSVQDFSIDNVTVADGLAVGRASSFVGKTVENLLSGIYTVEDQLLFKLLATLIDAEGIKLEPSALASLPGPAKLLSTSEGQKYIEQHQLKDKMNQATHIAWATGGSMVPKDEMEKYYRQGRGHY